MKMEKGLSAFTDKILSFEGRDQERILSAIKLVQEYSGGDGFGTASILLDLGMDADTIIAAIIMVLPEPPSNQFGHAVSLLNEGVKKLNRLKTNSKTVQEAQNIRNMFFVLADDINVILIKLAEKLHNLRVLDSAKDERRKIAARECLDIYTPLADRLGISWIKNEMEDLSLKFLNRETFQQIKAIVAEKLEQRNKFLDLAQKTIKTEANAAGMNVEVESRAKHFYSVYMKMRKRNKSAGEIFDLSGIRIICDSIENCYTLLGIVHHVGSPGNGTFRDYIAKPKPNGYQSLHTTIMLDEEPEGEQINDEKGKQLEIQIRTREMHRIAEHGIASHWLYKKRASQDMALPQEIDLANKLKGWKQESKDENGFSPSWLDGIKQEILRKNVYVFTPQGKVIKLPVGATPIDFAYHIHTAIGEQCIGAKADGHIIPLKSHLENKQVVEILTSPTAHPHFGWLESVKSSRARSKIKSWLGKNDEFFSSEKTTEEKKKPAEIPAALSVPGKVDHSQRVSQIMPSVLQVRIGDEKNMMIRFARCCKPTPDNPIIGYVSRGRGIIIHQQKCVNLANNPEVEKRKIAAEWDKIEPKPEKRLKQT